MAKIILNRMGGCRRFDVGCLHWFIPSLGGNYCYCKGMVEIGSWNPFSGALKSWLRSIGVRNVMISHV